MKSDPKGGVGDLRKKRLIVSRGGLWRPTHTLPSWKLNASGGTSSGSEDPDIVGLSEVMTIDTHHAARHSAKKRKMS